MKQPNTATVIASSLVAISVNAAAVWLYRRSKSKAIDAPDTTHGKLSKESSSISRTESDITTGSIDGDGTNSISSHSKHETATIKIDEDSTTRSVISSSSMRSAKIVADEQLLNKRKTTTSKKKVSHAMKSPPSLKISKRYPKTPLRKQRLPNDEIVRSQRMPSVKVSAQAAQTKAPLQNHEQQPELPKSPLLDTTNNRSKKTPKTKKNSRKINVAPKVRDSLLPASIRDNLIKKRQQQQQVENEFRSPIREACTSARIVQQRQKLYLSQMTNVSSQMTTNADTVVDRTTNIVDGYAPSSCNMESATTAIRVRDSLLPTEIRQKVLERRGNEETFQQQQVNLSATNEDKENPMVATRRRPQKKRQKYHVRNSMLPDSLKRKEDGSLLSYL